MAAQSALAADAVVGTGTAGSCTEATLNSAVATVEPGGGTISFNCGGAPVTINVSSQKVFDTPSVTSTIDGGGLITLNGQNATRILFHLGGTLNVRNLTLRNGRASGIDDNASGGAIRSDNGGVVLNLTNVTFLNNATNLTGVSQQPPFSPFDYGGGAVYTRLGGLNVTNCRFSMNTANNSSGGAIHGRSSAIRIGGSTFTANASNGGAFAGAMYVDGASPTGGAGTLEIYTSTFSDNIAWNIGGAFYFYLHTPTQSVIIDTAAFLRNQVVWNGGIPWLPTRVFGGAGVVDGGDVTIRNSTFASNVARSQSGGGAGGALHLGANQSPEIVNSTISWNRAEGSNSDASGGGLSIYDNAQPFQIINSTFAFNHAGWTGGGIQSASTGVLANTIVAHNTANNGGNPWNIQHQCASQLTDGGGVIHFPDVVGPPEPGDPRCVAAPIVADPLLWPLGDNGGYAPTHALGAGSPAIDNGSCIVGTDERGASRPQGAGCDIGAFEVLAEPDLIFADGFE